MKKIDIKAMFLLNISIILVNSVFAQVYQTSQATIDSNITTSIKPQGTSIGSVQNETSTDRPTTDAVDNITTSIKPQGTSIGSVQNETSTDRPTTDAVDNITTSIKPQGTSIDSPN
jgi:hypothetical protein